MNIQFDDDAIRRMTAHIAQQQADRIQKVYDRVLSMGGGRTPDEIGQLLIQEWQSTFGTEISDPELSKVAAILAEGRRIEVRPQLS